MTDPATAPTLADWLAAASDEGLTTLLRRRPDLTIPPPGSTRVLATRAEQRASVLRAAEELDTVDMTVLEVLAFAEADSAPVPWRDVLETITDRADRAGITTAGIEGAVRLSIERLLEVALVYGSPATAPGDQAGLRMVSAARAAVPWRIGRFAEAPVLSAAEIADRLAAVAAEEPPERQGRPGRFSTPLPRRHRSDRPATPLPVPRPRPRSRACWGPDCCFVWTTARWSCRFRSASTCAANRSPIRPTWSTRSPRVRPAPISMPPPPAKRRN